MTTTTNFAGATDARFRAVEDAFRENFDRFEEVGASLSVVVDGRTVVDIWGGHADGARTRPWERDTIATVWSTTKGIVAACAHRLAGEGKLDLDAPVVTYWPEFAQAGKEGIPVRYLLSHQAGLPALSEPMPMGSSFQWDVMTAAIARQEPWWEPGTKHGYHAFTYGWLVGEVIRRITGKTVGAYLRDEIAGPFVIDFQIGLPEADEPRTAEMVSGGPPPDPDIPIVKAITDPSSLTFKTLTNPPEIMLPATRNTREWRAAEIPAANGQGNGRAVARLYGALARGGELDGTRILTPEAIERATTVQCEGPDAVLMQNTRWGLGYFINSAESPLGPGERSFGHSGAGGSLGFADPDARIGFGYVMNMMRQTSVLEDPRWAPLIAAVYASL
ncbi:MAG: serine hydrolase domain-containing protein [Dehalococcoidia bacterium]